ncbi:MAG: class I SAM-dependent RNA methyltransferase [Deltaproteobacteria bacterium]|nr:MAG: class I SAM-dependent RNA methyltransferase [Deltaproteobacteria bacterium]
MPDAEKIDAPVVITGLAAGGDGVGRLADGCVVFVPFSVPGDQLRIRVVERRKRFARGEIEEILEPGEARTEPRCAVFGECGGCAWQHLEHQAQLAAKAQIIADSIGRIAGLALPGEVILTPSPSAYGYRARTRVLVEGGRVGYRKKHSHRLCAISTCPILTPELDALLAEIAKGPPLADGEWELCSAGGRVRSVRLSEHAGNRLSLDVGPDRVAFSAGVFAQSNGLLIETLVEHVLAAAGRGGQLLELFCGTGLFTLGLARNFDVVVAIESSASAVADLRANLRAAGRDNVEVVEGRVEEVLATRDPHRPAVVVLDPPRPGLAPSAIERLVALEAGRIVYLSCDPATLARDLGILSDHGYVLQRVECIDLFPQTPHIETLVTLEADPAVSDASVLLGREAPVGGRLSKPRPAACPTAPARTVETVHIPSLPGTRRAGCSASTRVEPPADPSPGHAVFSTSKDRATAVCSRPGRVSCCRAPASGSPRLP